MRHTRCKQGCFSPPVPSHHADHRGGDPTRGTTVLVLGTEVDWLQRPAQDTLLTIIAALLAALVVVAGFAFQWLHAAKWRRLARGDLPTTEPPIAGLFPETVSSSSLCGVPPRPSSSHP